MRRSEYSALCFRSFSGFRGAFLAGRLKFAVRWKTVKCFACRAICGIIWTPDEPVPITPTRFPEKSTPSLGQRPVWYQSPLNASKPGNSGFLGVDRFPVAIIHTGALKISFVSVPMVQIPASLSNVALVTRVLNWTSLIKSKRFATCWIYSNIAGCVPYLSGHFQSCCNCSSNE